VSSASLDESLVRFKATVASTISEEDSESHINLAEAYRSMGLYDEAVGEAAASLNSARRASVIISGLRMLLSPPLLTSAGLVRLKRRVRT
jgi:hypothetical protein